MNGWNKIEKTENISSISNSWLKGFFHDSHYDWDGKTWNRNFTELRTRDVAIMSLGEINSKKILDVGCGDGTYSHVMMKLGAIVSGQDLNYDNIELAKNRINDLSNLSKADSKGQFVCGNAKKLHFDSNSFDCVFSSDFFEHIDLNLKKEVLAEIYRVLKPGGILVIKTPNFDYLKIAIWIKRFFNFLKGKSPRIYIAHTNNNPDNEHHGLTNFKEMRYLLEDLFFHTPTFHHQLLIRKGLSKVVSDFLFSLKIKFFSEHLIISSKKSIFVGVSDSI